MSKWDTLLTSANTSSNMSELIQQTQYHNIIFLLVPVSNFTKILYWTGAIISLFHSWLHQEWIKIIGIATDVITISHFSWALWNIFRVPFFFSIRRQKSIRFTHKLVIASGRGIVNFHHRVPPANDSQWMRMFGTRRAYLGSLRDIWAPINRIHNQFQYRIGSVSKINKYVLWNYFHDV